MADYTKEEITDIHLAYEAENCSGESAQCLYAEQYPKRGIPSHNFFANLYQRLAETSPFQNASKEWVRKARIPVIEQNVLQQLQKTPSTNT